MDEAQKVQTGRPQAHGCSDAAVSQDQTLLNLSAFGQAPVPLNGEFWQLDLALYLFSSEGICPTSHTTIPKWILDWIILMFLPSNYSIVHSFRFFFFPEMFWCQKAVANTWKDSSKFCIYHLKCAKINGAASEAEHWAEQGRARAGVSSQRSPGSP